MILRAGTLLTVLALLAAGCGGSTSGSGSSAATPKPVDPNGKEVSPSGDIPDDQAYVAYSPPGGGFSVKVPEGWSRTTSGGAVTFTDKLNSIGMETMAAGGPLTEAQARHAVPSGKVSTVKRPAGDAVRITYLGSSKPDAVTGKSHTNAIERYVFFHNGKRIVLTLSGPKGADNVDPWKIVTDSLRFTR